MAESGYHYQKGKADEVRHLVSCFINKLNKYPGLWYHGLSDEEEEKTHENRPSEEAHGFV
jgi:hypothetical protein